MQKVKSLTCRQIGQMFRSYNTTESRDMIAVIHENNTDVYKHTYLVSRDKLKSKAR